MMFEKVIISGGDGKRHVVTMFNEAILNLLRVLVEIG